MTNCTLPKYRSPKIGIIGGGAAGVMAAMRGALNNDKVLLFPGSAKDRKKSRAQWVTKIENMPAMSHYKKGIVDPHKAALEELQAGPFGHNVEFFKNTGIVNAKKINDAYELTDSSGAKHTVDYLVLATGVMDIQPLVQGKMAPVFPYANTQLIDYCLRCDGHHVLDTELAIIGHSNVAAWVSIMLHERYRPKGITILTHGQDPEFSVEAQEVLKAYKIQVQKHEIVDIIGQPREKKLESFVLSCGATVSADIAFVSLGMIVYNELAVELGVEVDDRGFVVTNKKGESSLSGVYAVGDLQAGIKKQVYTAWDSAVDSLDDINSKIRSNYRAHSLKKLRGEA